MSNNPPPPLAPRSDVGAISPVLPTTTQSTQSSSSFEHIKSENEVGPCNDDKKEQRMKTTRTDVVGDTVVLAGGPTKRTAEDMQGDDVSSSSSSSSHSSHSNVKINNPSTRNRDKKRVKPNNANHPTIDDSTSCKSNETSSAAVTFTTQTSSYQQAQPQPQPQPIPQQPAIVEDITYYPSRGNMTSSSSGNPNEAKRWRAHRMAEDYIQLSSQMMMPGIHLAPFGYDATTGQFPVESITALSILLSPLRRPTVVEKWSPYEIAVFEAALAVVGKEFHQVQKFVKTKSTKDIIEFYYIWKKTAHYKVWKRQYILPEDDVDSDDD